VGTLKSRWMVSKKKDTRCGLRAGVGATTVGVEAVAGLGVDGLAVGLGENLLYRWSVYWGWGGARRMHVTSAS
jgi:hypothetical protein